MSDKATPHAAAFVIFRKAGKIAFVLRQNTGWMDGCYGLPSGRVEKDETAASAAIREAKEETGVDVPAENLKPVLAMHRRSGDSDWVDFMFEATSWEGELINAEPHLHGGLEWFDPKRLPENIIPAVRKAIEAIESGDMYAEHGWDN